MSSKEYFNLDNKPTHSTNRVVIICLIAALAIALGFLFYEKNKFNSSLGENEFNINKLERSREMLKQDLRIARAEYDSVKSSVKQKNSKLETKDAEIYEKQKIIQNLLNQEKITRKDLKDAQDLILSFRTELYDYKIQIEELKKQNKELKEKNKQLQDINNVITTENSTLSTNLVNVTTEKEEEKANVNATLSVSNYQLTGIIIKNSGKEVETERARKINKLKVTFDLDPNKNGIAELKDIYIAIYKPDGKIGHFEGANYGKIPLRNGKIAEYSDNVIVDYKPKEGNNVTFYWEDYDFPKGIYKIDIYQNGFKIGQNKIQLK